jgi:hypothetical protein
LALIQRWQSFLLEELRGTKPSSQVYNSDQSISSRTITYILFHLCVLSKTLFTSSSLFFLLLVGLYKQLEWYTKGLRPYTIQTSSIELAWLMNMVFHSVIHSVAMWVPFKESKVQSSTVDYVWLPSHFSSTDRTF